MEFEKHTGVYPDKLSYESDVDKGILKAPWVAYVQIKENSDYEVYYSTDALNGSQISRDVYEERLLAIENQGERIFLSTVEYENLINKPGEYIEIKSQDENGEFTKIRKIKFNPNAYYYTYEPEA